MTPEQARKLLEELTGTLKLTRKEHEVVLEAIRILAER